MKLHQCLSVDHPASQCSKILGAPPAQFAIVENRYKGSNKEGKSQGQILWISAPGILKLEDGTSAGKTSPPSLSKVEESETDSLSSSDRETSPVSFDMPEVPRYEPPGHQASLERPHPCHSTCLKSRGARSHCLNQRLRATSQSEHQNP